MTSSKYKTLGSSPKYLILRENSDLEKDEETIHTIKAVHLPEFSGTSKAETDFALIELENGANNCSAEEKNGDRCWPIKPVNLPRDDLILSPGIEVRTLGEQQQIFLNIFQTNCIRLGSH